MRHIVALLIAILPAVALADEPPSSLPDVVVTATRLPTPEADVPAGVTVVTRAEIQQRGYNTLVDALSAVPGVRVSQAGGPGGQASVFIRGTNSNHVLVLRDGMPINDASDPTGAFDFGKDTLSDIARIEVIRGPMAALYGSGAIGGVINLISLRGTEPGPHFTADLAGGYPATVRAAATATGLQGPFDYALSAESQSQRGYDTIPQRMDNYTGTPQGYRDRVGMVNLGYTPIEGTRLSLLFRARQAIFGFDTLGLSPPPTFDTANSSGSADSLLARVGVTSALFNGVYETSLFLGHLQEDRHFTELFDPRDPNQASSDDRYHAYRTDLQWNNTVHLDDLLHAPALSASALTFGFERTEDRAKVRLNEANLFGPFNENVDATATDNAIYAGLQGTLWDKLTVTGQVRQDWVLNDAPTTWRLGAVFDVPRLATRFKAAYGTAFRAPSLFDRFGVSQFFVGNPNLLPESAQGWEVGFATTLPGAGRPDMFFGGITYFNEQIRDLITTPIMTPINIGSAHIQGVEAEVTVHPANWLSIQATYTFTDAQDADQGTRLLRRPQNAASLDVTVTPLTGLKIVGELVYTGAFHDILYDNSDSLVGVGTSQHGTIANVSITYDVAPHVQLYVDARNVLYSRFEPVNGFQTPGPTVLAGMRVRL
ncbi:MAG TPA: TonB-dependent receptor [Acetobacteraceae bacterium]|nr:TonB-dependent receptor [Acetobacteraceae bacterium]